MDSKLTKMLLIMFLFVVGILIGLESANGGLEKAAVEEMDITPSSYVTRIENGELIMVPAHGSGKEKDIENGKDMQGEKNEKETLESEVQSSNEQRSEIENSQQGKQEIMMNREGFLDRLGYNMGNAISSWTRTALEKAIGAIVD
jgi:hypothetical protein